MFFHVCWAVFLYSLLTIVRAPVIWGLDTKSGKIAKQRILEPRISANLSNQFEWPLLFYTCCILIIISGAARDDVQLGLAWVFVIGRVIHSGVQILTSNIRLRGAVFTINFLAVFAMWVRLVLGV
ncbi:MAPEG family protein [Cellvibrio mixtus]|uniref:MAPEG family protein n=1 Tax=Cellvibrio mixtus TaxID=39650 RepID=UPI00126A6831|nr:MAPEG family protein [Cellvibrio mixtus]